MTASGFARKASVLTLVMSGVLAISSACGVGDLSLVGKGCPCATDQGYVCDTTTQKCVLAGAADDAGIVCADAGCACTVDAECVDPAFPKCVGSQCVGCSVTPDSCPANTYCLPSTQTCTPGCKADSECASNQVDKFCDTTRHQCHSCRPDHGNADCTIAGEVCSPTGTCAVSCSGDASSCTGGTTCCSGLCIDTASDVANCGGCEVKCSGVNTPPGPDTLCCNSACVDPLTTTQYCGGCGTACSPTNDTPTCAAGACNYNCNSGFGHCQAGNTGCETSNLNSLHQCGAACVDCTTAILHANGAACSGNGGTTCDYTTCSSSSYLDNDGNRSNGCETHCGTPNQVCCPGGICNIGTCQGNNRCPDD